MNKLLAFYKKISDIATPTAVLAIICVVVTLALSSTNALTANKIKALAVETQNKAMAKLVEADNYSEHTITTNDGDVTYNTAEKDGKTVGLIFVTEENGYGGAISVMTAIDMEGKVVAVEILAADDETPGLGQNVTKPEWYSQFTGLIKGISVTKSGNAKAENNEINAVTGATISSNAVTKAVNRALDYASIILEKGDKS